MGKERTSVELIARGEKGWGAALKTLRKSAGLSQNALAEAVEIDNANIARYESEQQRPSADTLRKILSALNVDAKLLYKLFGQKAREILATALDEEQIALELSHVLIEEAGGADRQGTAERITELMDNRVLAATAMRAMRDSVSARLYFEQSDRIRSRSFQRRYEEARNITPSTQFLPAARETSEEPQ